MIEVQIKKVHNGYVVIVHDINSIETYVYTNLREALDRACSEFKK